MGIRKNKVEMHWWQNSIGLNPDWWGFLILKIGLLFYIEFNLENVFQRKSRHTVQQCIHLNTNLKYVIIIIIISILAETLSN